MGRRTGKSATPIDRAPNNLKFGVLVATATLWAQLVRSVLDWLLGLVRIEAPILADLLVALIASIVGYFGLAGYRRIRARVNKLAD